MAGARGGVNADGDRLALLAQQHRQQPGEGLYEGSDGGDVRGVRHR